MYPIKKTKRHLKKKRVKTVQNTFRVISQIPQNEPESLSLAGVVLSDVEQEADNKEKNSHDNSFKMKKANLHTFQKNVTNSSQFSGNMNTTILSCDSLDEIVLDDPSYSPITVNNSSDIEDFNNHENQIPPIDISDTLDQYSSDNECISEKEDFFVFESHNSEALILVLHEHAKVMFIGKALIKCLSGSANIMSYILNQSEEDYVPLYGPSAYPLPLISWRDIPTRKRFSVNLIKNFVNVHLAPQLELVHNILSVMQPTSTILLLKPLSAKLNFKGTTLNNLFRCRERFQKDIFKRMGFSFFNCNASQCFFEEKIFERVLDTVSSITRLSPESDTSNNSSPVILVCGAKNIGKSSLLRLIVNQLLGYSEEVLYLDLDPGQPEFTPSGCVSLIKVESPLLGPAFTHQCQPLASRFIGGNSPAHNPELYIASVEALLPTLDSNQVLVINTMGWTKGVGLSLLVDIVRLCKPTILIQMKDQMTPLLDAEYFHTACGWLTNRTPELQDFHYQLIKDPGFNDTRKGYIRIESFRLRGFAMLSYMEDLLKSQVSFNNEAFQLNAITPFQVSFNAVEIKSYTAELSSSQSLLAVNAAWVALCVIDKKKRTTTLSSVPHFMNECLGFGIVRGVDSVNQLFYVLTPLTLPTLQKVNALVMGDDDLPIEFLTNQKISKSISYMTELKIDPEYQSVLDYNGKMKRPRFNRT